MANPLKVLTALSASAGAAISGSSGLKVQEGGLTVDAGGLTVSVGNTVVQTLTASAISGTGAAQIGGGLTVAGASALQGVTATTVSASSTGQFGGDLTVGGTSNLQAVTASAVSASGAAQVGGALTVAGASALQGVTATTVSASSTGQFGGNLTTAGDLTVGGNTIAGASGSAIELGTSGSTATILGGLTVGNDDGTAGSITLRNNHATMFSVDSSGNGHFDGDLSIGGTLSVETINYASSSAITLGDKYIIIASGATDHASLDGSGILFGSGSGGYGTHGSIIYRDSIDKLEILPGISSSAITGTELHIHGAGSQVHFNGALTVDGGTILNGNVDLGEFSSNVVTVHGQLTASAGIALTGQLSASGELLVGGGLTVAGASALQGLTATTVSASSNGQFGGTLEVAGVSTLHAVTASAVSASGELQVGGGLTVVGATALQGLTATTFSGSSNTQVGGDLTVGGTAILQAVSASAISASGVISGDGSGLINLSASQLNNFAADVQAAMGGGNIVTPAEYYSVRQAVTGTVTNAGQDMLFFFSGSSVIEGTNEVTGAALAGVSGAGYVLDAALPFVSFDVAVQAYGTTTWTNDLVSVQVTKQMGGDMLTYFPLFTVSAPSLESGSKVRLIVVNEKKDVIG